MAQDPQDENLQQSATDFLRLLIKAVKAHQQAVTDSTLVTAALVQAVAEKFPEIGESYTRHLEHSQKHSPIAESNRQVLAQLDKLTAGLED